MDNHIDLLLNHLNQYADNCVSKNLMSDFNRKSISIDFSSKSRQGDISSNFYLVAVKKVLDKSFNLEHNIVDQIKKLSLVENCEISKNGFINITIKRSFLIEQIDILLQQKK